MKAGGVRRPPIAAWTTAVTIALTVWFVGAGAATASLGAPGSLSDSLLADGLLEPNASQAQEAARLASPEAVRARAQSAGAFVGLGAQAAEAALQEADPSTVDQTNGGPPPLAAGQSVIGFPSDYAMTIDLGNGKRALVESLSPVALETAPAKRTPVDLGLRETAGGFQPAAGLAPVLFGRRASEGASLLDSGVSLTPVNESGGALDGTGTIDHANSLFYGDTEDEQAGIRDLGLLAKPSVGGFELYSVLFSKNSPEHLYYKVGLPEGAALVQADGGDVRVMREGVPIAVIPRPSARDAEGTFVPVSMSVTGETIELSVPRAEGQFRYPLLVDPHVEDTTLVAPSHGYTNWVPAAETASKFNEFSSFEGWELDTHEAYGVGEWVDVQYETQGESKIYEFAAEVLEEDYETGMYSFLQSIKESTGTSEYSWAIAENNSYPREYLGICAQKGSGCKESEGTNKNLVRYVQEDVAPPKYMDFRDVIYKAVVWISQEKAPTATFNTSEPTIKIEEPNGTTVERENVLYPGSKGWIGPHSNTAFETVDHDPGIGVSFAAADGGSWSRESFIKEGENKCSGMQCHEEFKGKFTYYTTTPEFTKPMPDGEYEIESFAEDALGLYGYSYHTVRVDATAPAPIKLSGLPSSGQLGEGVYKIKAEATDGKTGVPSSGVASLKLGIDGAEAGEPKGSCSPGPCTTSGEWTINGGQLSAGSHVLTIVATDNAGNVSHEDFVIFVHHASPIALGPGSLDPQSGNYSLGASDVSMGPGLTLTRSYSSRNLTAGVEGGLGPQWATSLGGSENLEELADGSMVLTATGGGETTFQRNSKGELESPKGDTNVALSAQTNEQGVPTAYYFKDSASGTTTKFARATGYLQTAPNYYGEMGWQGPGTGQLNAAMGVAVDAKGDAWVADTKNNRIEQFNPQGEYSTQFGYEGSGGGALKEPRGVAIDSKGNIWVADTDNNRIEKFNEKGEYLLQAGTAGTGALKGPQGIAIDSSANVWVADTGDNRVVEFNEKGEYVREASKAVGSHTLSEPVGIAVDKSADAWVTDAKNHRFVEFGPTGAALKEYGALGTGNSQFETPSGIAIDAENDVYVADYVENRVQEFNSKGEFLTKFASSGSNGGQLKKPYLMAIDARGALLIADSENSRVERWAHAAWFPAVSEGPVSTSQVSYTYKAVRASAGTLIEPTEVLAPHASELSCSPTLNKGCRALVLKYAETTSATGEAESQWGQYEGRLKEVLFAAYNPSTTKVEEKAVAQYAYDGKGRLRAEWDPRIKPELKTVYGYDSEGHLTALSQPGQEPWLIHYGTIAADASAGRALSVTRPAAATAIGSRLAPANVTQPTLSSTTPSVGAKIAVSNNGTWNNEPLAYSYQWQDCNSAGAECTAIPGAVNESYYPAVSDEGHTLKLQVSATNAGGSGLATSSATGLVKTGTPYNPAPEPPSVGTSAVTTVEYGVPVSGAGLQNLTAAEAKKWGQEDDPLEGTAVFQPYKPMGWPAKEYTSSSLLYFDSEGRTVNNVNPSGGVSTSEYNASNNAVRTLSADNRATALAEGSKSAEVAAKLDDRSVYNEEGDELLETFGPEHKVKLASGAEVQARHRVKYYYDEGSPEGKEYRLVTKTVGSAVVAGKEEEPQTTRTYYSGQNGLGWTLRKPTSVVSDPSGLSISQATLYDPSTGAVLETRKGSSAAGTTFDGLFGNERGGKSRFNWPEGSAVDAKDNIWVADTYNDRIQEYSSSGAFIRQFGSWGTGNEQMEYPKAITVDGKGHVWTVDPGAERVQEFSETGTYIEKFGTKGTGNGQFENPEGIAVDSKGNVWVVDEALNRVQEFSESGTYMTQIGEEGTTSGKFREPRRVLADAKGNIWVSDGLNCRIQEFNEKHEVAKVFGSCGKGNGELNNPQGMAVDSSGHIWVADEGNDRIEQFSESGAYLGQFGEEGTGNGKLLDEEDLAIDSAGHIWVLDSGNSRMEEFSSTGSYMTQFGSKGTPEGALYNPKGVAVDNSGDIWVADTNNHRIMEYSEAGEYLSRFGSEGSGPGQFEAPRAITVDRKGNIWVLDQTNDRVNEFNTKGEVLLEFGSAGTENGKFKEPQGLAIDTKGNVWVSDTGNNRIQEFHEKGEFVRKFGALGSGHEQFNEPKGLAVDVSGDVWVADSNNNRVEELSEEGKYVTQFGSWGSNEGQLKWPLGVTLDAAGHLWVVDTLNSRVQEFNQKGSLLGSFGSAGSGNAQMNEPRSIALDTHGNAWVADTNNNRIEHWTVATPADTQTVYYTAEANGNFPTCGGHVESEGMPCETMAAAQPGHSSAPALPVTAVESYNMWGEPETAKEVFPATEGFAETTRTKKTTYDEAGRVTSTEETSTSSNKALPKVTNGYNETTGQTVKQETTVGEETQKITSVYNRLGRLTSYTDADGNATTYEYEASGAGRLTSVSDLKGYQDYAYDPTTGALTKLVDSAAKEFTASYDVEGVMTKETYPNGMTATYAHDAAGEPVAIEYVKTTHCSEKCQLFAEAVVPAVDGEALSRANTLTNDTYSYDTVGRLTQTTEEPTGKGCTTRVYAYDEESNRRSLTTREPGTGGKCATEGGTLETHAYDSANRLTDPGVSYEALGDTTKLPATDAGGHELTSEYYSDGQILKQSQNGQTNTYYVDPAGRIRKTVGEGTTNLSTIDHYGAGEALTWKDEGSGKYTRLIPGIDGTLSATQANGEGCILQLHDLQGDVIGTAADSETETKLLSTYNSTEFGVPVNGSPPTKYSWLGASGVSSELTSGALVSGTVAYQPQLGRALQTEAVTPPGMAIGGAEGVAYRTQASAWSMASADADTRGHATEYAIEQQQRAEQEALEKRCPYEIASMCPQSEENAIEYGPEVDPHGLLTWQKTNQRAETFSGWAGEIQSAIAYDANFGVVKILEEEETVLTKAAARLEKCAQAVKDYKPLGECWLHYTTRKISVPLLGEFTVLTEFHYSTCTWDYGHVAHHEWFYCPGAEGHKYWAG